MYLQYGASFSGPESWVNFDASPTLRVERIPIIGPALSRVAKRNPQRFAPHIRYGDILRGLPIPDDSANAVYASHVLEHLSRRDVDRALRNTWRILKPGAVFRLIVPDLEVRTERYFRERGSDPLACDRFMRSTLLAIEQWPSSWLARLTLQFGVSRHLWMWDYPSDLPLKFHPAATRAFSIHEPLPNLGPPEGRVFRPWSRWRAGGAGSVRRLGDFPAVVADALN